MRALVDTCVIMDALQSRVPFAEAAQKIFIHMVETAIRSEMDCIVTRNEKDYMKSPVKVYEPSVFLKLFEVEKETE